MIGPLPLVCERVIGPVATEGAVIRDCVRYRQGNWSLFWALKGAL